MRIKTLWIWHDHDAAPELVAAVDELTLDYVGGNPDAYEAKRQELPEAEELEIEIPSAAVYVMFEHPVVEAAIVAPSEDV